MTLTAGAGVLALSVCLTASELDPVALVAYNESSHTQHLRVRLFRPDGESIETYSYAIEPGDAVDEMHTVSGTIGEIAASAQAQNTGEELPDARTQYAPDIECQRGRPDIVVTMRDEGIRFSYAC